nr:hypothetical protein CFP56_52212 [Quercus suber]
MVTASGYSLEEVPATPTPTLLYVVGNNITTKATVSLFTRRYLTKLWRKRTSMVSIIRSGSWSGIIVQKNRECSDCTVACHLCEHKHKKCLRMNEIRGSENEMCSFTMAHRNTESAAYPAEYVRGLLELDPITPGPNVDADSAFEVDSWNMHLSGEATMTACGTELKTAEH